MPAHGRGETSLVTIQSHGDGCPGDDDGQVRFDLASYDTYGRIRTHVEHTITPHDRRVHSPVPGQDSLHERPYVARSSRETPPEPSYSKPVCCQQTSLRLVPDRTGREKTPAIPSKSSLLSKPATIKLLDCCHWSPQQ